MWHLSRLIWHERHASLCVQWRCLPSPDRQRHCKAPIPATWPGQAPGPCCFLILSFSASDSPFLRRINMMRVIPAPSTIEDCLSILQSSSLFWNFSINHTHVVGVYQSIRTFSRKKTEIKPFQQSLSIKGDLYRCRPLPSSFYSRFGLLPPFYFEAKGFGYTYLYPWNQIKEDL